MVWISTAPPPFWQINHANSAYFRLFWGYFWVISATCPPPLWILAPLFILDPPLAFNSLNLRVFTLCITYLTKVKVDPPTAGQVTGIIMWLVFGCREGYVSQYVCRVCVRLFVSNHGNVGVPIMMCGWFRSVWTPIYELMCRGSTSWIASPISQEGQSERTFQCFLPFLPIFPLFPNFPILIPIFPDFWPIFCCQGGTPLPLYWLRPWRVGQSTHFDPFY